jgi:hypothetical protein
MRRGHVFGAVLVVSCTVLCLASWGASPPRAAAPPAWEYKAIEQSYYPGHLEKEFNDLGRQGWEYCGSHQAEYRKEREVVRPVTVSVFKRSRPRPGE